MQENNASNPVAEPSDDDIALELTALRGHIETMLETIKKRLSANPGETPGEMDLHRRGTISRILRLTDDLSTAELHAIESHITDIAKRRVRL